MENIKKYIYHLKMSKGIYFLLAKRLKGYKKYKFYYFAGATINRAMALNDAYLKLSKEGNYIAATPLIRMMLDNAMTSFSGMLVENLDEYFDYIDSGKIINRYKDKRGNPMFEKYLKQELNKEYPGIKDLYSKTSEYIHLSTDHIRAAFRDNEDYIGKYDMLFSREERKQIDKYMLEANNLLLNVFVKLSRKMWLEIKDQVKEGELTAITENFDIVETTETNEQKNNLTDDFEPIEMVQRRLNTLHKVISNKGRRKKNT